MNFQRFQDEEEAHLQQMLDFLTHYAHSWETLCETLVISQQTLCYQTGFAPRAPAQVAPLPAAGVLSVPRLVECFVEARRTGHERPQPAVFEDRVGGVVVVVAGPGAGFGASTPSDNASGALPTSVSNPNWTNPPGAQLTQNETVASSILHPTISPSTSSNPAPKTSTATAPINPSSKTNVPNSNSLYNLLVQPEPPPNSIAQSSTSNSKISAILQLYKQPSSQNKASSSSNLNPQSATADTRSSIGPESSTVTSKTLTSWPSVPDESTAGSSNSALSSAKDASQSGRSASIDKHPIFLAAQTTGPPTVPATSTTALAAQQPSSTLSSFSRFFSVSDLFRSNTHGSAQQADQQQQQQHRVAEQQQQRQGDNSDESTGASQTSRGSGHFEKHEPEKKRREGTRSFCL